MTDLLANSIKIRRNITIKAGLALFAMFFGASNLIFPLYIGANSGQHIFSNIAGFLIGGVGIPIVGLIATGMFNGDYLAFFNRLGRVPGYLLIFFLILIVGPLGAMPRIETLVFSTLEPFMPQLLKTNAVFSIIFCSLVFFLAYKKNKIVEILGVILSPIKIITVLVLIVAGTIHWNPEIIINQSMTTAKAIKNSLIQGYCTMDLLATYFFSVIAFQFVNQHKAQLENYDSNLTRIMINASIIAGSIISCVYIGFMLLSYNHAGSLQNIPPVQMVTAVSSIVLGKFGSLYVCITVSFACLSTVLALSDVCTDYIDKVVTVGRVSRAVILFTVVLITYITSNFGFQQIMSYMTPILEVIYPALITLSVMNILYKCFGIKTVKIPVFLVGIVFLLKNYFNIF